MLAFHFLKHVFQQNYGQKFQKVLFSRKKKDNKGLSDFSI